MSDAKLAITLYDADAEQRFEFKFGKGGRLYTVAHSFGPVGDDDITEYDRSRNVRLSEADISESDDPNATAITGESFQAALSLWEKCKTSVENYKDQNKVPARHKAFAVQHALLATEIRPLPSVGEAEAFPDDDDESSTITLRVLFAGVPVDTHHVLRAANAEDMELYRSIMARALLVNGTKFGKQDQRIPSRARRLGQLYDSVRVSATGYVGRVPLHHKMAVVLDHFKDEQEVLGN